MAYVVVQDFRDGLDRRKSAVTAPPGSLRTCANAQLTRGGEIERRKAFVAAYNLPAGTFGLEIASGDLYVFGSGAEPANMPANVTYQRLQHPDNLSMTEVVTTDVFGGKPYVVAKYTGNLTAHFYDGELVKDWMAGLVRASFLNNNGTAANLAELIDEHENFSANVTNATVAVQGPANGAPFNVTVTTENVANGTDDQNIAIANITTAVAEVTETLASALATVANGTSGNQITNLTVNAVAIINTSTPVNWTTSPAGTAAALADAINNFTSTPDYTATVAGNIVTIKPLAGTGATTNGMVVAATSNMTINTTNMAGGVTAANGTRQQTNLTVNGTYEVGDKFTLTFGVGASNITFGAVGPTGENASAILTHQSKLYATAGPTLYFSKLDDPTIWDTEQTGAGFITMSNEANGYENLTALGVYQRNVVAFARRATQIWAMDANASANTRLQALPNIGTMARHSVVAYGDSDVFFLSDTGIRSLRARDSSNAAYANDVGTPIDPLVTQKLLDITEAEAQNAHGVIEPIDGRYWLAIKDEIFVFSFFPTSKISAWSTFVPGFESPILKTVDNKIFARSGDTIYLYGGSDLSTYDTSETTVETPYIDARSIATFKQWKGIDIACTGEWRLYYNANPSRETDWTLHSVLSGSTFHKLNVPFTANSPLIKFKFVSDKAAAATLSNLVVHFDAARSD